MADRKKKITVADLAKVTKATANYKEEAAKGKGVQAAPMYVGNNPTSAIATQKRNEAMQTKEWQRIDNITKERENKRLAAMEKAKKEREEAEKKRRYGMEYEYAAKVASGNASKSDILISNSYRRERLYKLDNIEKINDDIQAYAREYTNYTNGSRYYSPQDYDSFMARGEQLKSRINSYVDYAELYDDANYGNYKKLYADFSTDVKNLETAKKNMSMFKDSNELKAARGASDNKNYSDLQKQRASLEGQLGRLSKEDNEAILSQLKYLDTYGFTQSVVDSMTADDWEAEKKRAESKMHYAQSKYNEYNAYSFIDRHYADAKSRGLSDDDAKAELKMLRENAKKSYMDTKEHLDNINSMSMELKAFEKSADSSTKEEGFWSWLGKSAAAGLSGFNKALAQSLDFVMPTDFLGSDDPFSALNEYYSQQSDVWSNEATKVAESKGKAFEFMTNHVIAPTVQALPQAVLALMTGGGSVASSAMGTSGIGVSQMINSMAKNPSFWLSFMTTAGNDYETAKEAGANDFVASASAIITSLLNAGVEIGGGIEKLPDSVKNGGQSAVKSWVNSMVEEGGEEIVQGIVSQSVAKLMYDHDMETLSFTNNDALINPARSAKEFMGGAVVGGILGGGQIGAATVVNKIHNKFVATEVRENAGSFLVENGLSRASVTKYLIDNGVSDDRTLARVSNGIVDMGSGKKIDSKTESEIKENPLYRGLLHGYVDVFDIEAEYKAQKSTFDNKSDFTSDDGIRSDVYNKESKETHTPEQLRIMGEYENAVDNDVIEFIEYARSTKNDNRTTLTLNDVSERAAEEIKILTGIDTEGFEHVIKVNTVRHIDANHGVSGRTDHSMADDKDLARIEYVLENYDTVEILDDHSKEYRDKNQLPAPIVKYSKRVDGTYYIVEAVPDTKKRQLPIISAYKNKAAEQQTRDVHAPTRNVRNDSADATFVDSTLSQTKADVNKNVRKNEQIYSDIGIEQRDVGGKSDEARFSSSRWATESFDEGRALKNASVGDIVDFVRDKFGVPISTGKIHSKDTRGIYKVRAEAIRTQIANNLPTIAHELGHHLDKKYRLSNMSVKELMHNCNQGFLNQYPVNQRPGEAVAEFVRTYLKNREEAKAMSPMFYDEFINSISKEDLKNLDILANTINKYMSGDFEQRVKSAIVSSKKAKKTPARDKASKFYTDWVDSFFPQKQATDFIQKAKDETLSGNKNAYKLATNSLNAAAIAHYITTQGMTNMKGDVKIGKSFIDCIKEVKPNQLNALDEYLVLRHSLEWISPVEGESKRVFADDTLQNTANIKRRIEAIEKANPEIKEAAENLYEFQDNVMKNFVVAGGGLTAEAYSTLKEKYPSYVPFYRAVNSKRFGTAKSGFANQRTPISKAKGSGLEIISPLESIIKNTEKMVKFATRNRVMQVWAHYADTIDGFGKFMEKVPPDMLPRTVDIAIQKGNISEALKRKLGSDDYFAVTDIIDEYLNDSVTDFTPVASAKKKIVTVMQNGKAKYYQIHDEELYNSLSNLSPSQTKGALDVLGKIMVPMKMLMTQVNPIFAATNVLKDMGTAYRNSDVNNPIEFLMGYVASIKHIVTNSEMYQKYKAVGGGHSSELSASLDDVSKTLRKVAQKDMNLAMKFADSIFLHPIQTMVLTTASVNDFMETLPRLAEFARVLEKGGDIQEAIYRADDITTNFKRGGVAGKKANKLFMYFNASVQGLDRMYRSFKDATPKERAARVGKYAIVSLLTTALLQYWNRREDEEGWGRLSAYTKNNFYCISTGDGKFIKLPKSRENAILDSLTSNLSDYIFGDDDAFDKFGEYLALNLVPPGIPTSGLDITSNLHDVLGSTIFGGIADLGFNMDFKKTPIESAYDESLPVPERYSDNTSAIAVAIGQTRIAQYMNLSPKEIDHLIKSYGGVLASFNSALFPSNSANRDKSLGVKNKFVADSLYSTDMLNDVYESRDSLKKTLDIEKTSSVAMEYEEIAIKASFITNANKIIKQLPENERRDGRAQLLKILGNWDNKLENSEKLMAKLLGKAKVQSDNSALVISLPSAEINRIVDGKELSAILSPQQYIDYVNDYLSAINKNRMMINHAKDIDLYVGELADAKSRAASNVTEIYSGILFVKDNFDQYKKTAMQMVNNAFESVSKNISDTEIRNGYISRVYEAAKEVSLEQYSNGKFFIEKDWISQAKRMTDKERAEYLYGKAIVAKYGNTSAAKELIYDDKKISNEIKMRVISTSRAEKYDAYLSKYKVDPMGWMKIKDKYEETKDIGYGKSKITKKELIVAYIHSAPLDDRQKSAIYRALGYSDETSDGKINTKGIPWKYSFDITQTSNFKNKVGKKVTDTRTYNNDAAKGQCVWFVRGRAYEKLGKNIPALGNANEMYANAKESARLEATLENLQADTLMCYKKGTSAAGQTAGHVIYIEEVIGNAVYYTEGGYGANNGILKVTSRENILRGYNGHGGRIGSGAIGLIDVAKY